ncbi:MAG: glutamate-5-semialdehyde dehydrogenase [Firmicutes bacterium]|jgi:glutamate-5-semialdehyde dehydrogenase|nr:glutamate-5-semialdehyde dehydrogenase [Bacillota bacterium]HQD39818.1 glutamate-5-semialdehyde dehydrogenase [Bacillota bacterium]
MTEDLRRQVLAAKEAARKLRVLSSSKKNAALLAMAKALRERADEVLAANREDLDQGRERGLSKALLDRLALNQDRVEGLAKGLEEVAALPDPVGEVEGMWKRPNDLQVGLVRVPLGVVAMIYEARPNVTADAAGLCLKAGNSVVLRGGSEAIRSNIAIGNVICDAIAEVGLPKEAVCVVQNTDRKLVRELIRMHDAIDVVIPRGGAGLIRTVVEEATVPVIETGVGNCHTYVDKAADLQMALEIAINAKIQRPGVCNAMETLLVHGEIAEAFLPKLAEQLLDKVELRGCPETCRLIPQAKPATEEDWATEYLDYILAIRVVPSFADAVAHINQYSTGHSEAIVTEDYSAARRFLEEIDAAAVYVNASTRFTDGGQFGLGAEIGISTQKLHARGPMGLKALTTTKFIIYGEGQIRK